MIKWAERNSPPKVREALELERQQKDLWEACVILGNPDMLQCLKELYTKQWDERAKRDVVPTGITGVWSMPTWKS